VSATLVSALRGVLPLLFMMLAAAPAYGAGPTSDGPPAPVSAQDAMPAEEWSEEPDPAAEALYADSLDSLTGSYPVRCKRVRAARVHTNGAWNDLWKYWQQQGFCHNGSRVTSLYDWRRWPCCVDPGWKFEGHVGRTRSGGAGQWSYSTWTQGHFSFGCSIQCLSHSYPWVRLTVRGNGTWTKSTGQ
jgi:hypothetical protein